MAAISSTLLVYSVTAKDTKFCYPMGHLVPVETTDFPEYRARWEALLCSSPAAARMVVLPPSQPEFSVSLNVKKTDANDADTFLVTVVKAEKSIWNATRQNSETELPVKTKTVEATLDTATGIEILRLWRYALATIKRQRETEEQHRSVILDSAEMEFSVVLEDGHKLYARAPDFGNELSKFLTEIGLDLLKYSELPEGGRLEQGRRIRAKIAP